MSPDAVHVYWRPGCMFCSVLRRGLGRAGIDTVEHDIWQDEAAAAVVRSFADGDETVPTVVVGDVGMVNPTSRQVVEHLERAAPHLLPDDHEPARPGLLGRLLGG